MDFVYICKPGDNEELRYSIRSVLYSFPDANIWLVGGKPSWYSGNYIYVDQKHHKYANAINNLHAICDSNEISEEFVLMNDDFFISFIEIAQNNATSFLRRIGSNFFTETTYDKVFSRIQTFINRESEVDIRADLRPFLESLYLPHFYIKEFKAYRESDTPFSTLSEKIDAIFLDETVKAKFHEFITMLNPDSHLFTSSNEEDVRSFAREMMEYLYNFSHNN
jgi:hypothetical protein